MSSGQDTFSFGGSPPDALPAELVSQGSSSGGGGITEHEVITVESYGSFPSASTSRTASVVPTSGAGDAVASGPLERSPNNPTGANGLIGPTKTISNNIGETGRSDQQLRAACGEGGIGHKTL